VSKARLVITAITKQGLSQAEAARTYGISEAWVSRLMARHRTEGEAAYTPRSRRPKTSPNALDPATVELILQLRNELAAAGLDAGPETIAWHLEQHHSLVVSRATISRHLTKAGLVTPEPRKRPKSSYIRFQAQMPNETWQSDFTHYRLTHPDGQPGPDVEIITWLDDCTRNALHVTAHKRITATIVTTTFRQTATQQGIPASTLTDNGMVYTTRLAGLGRQGGRNSFEAQLRTWNVVQKNSRPSHPTTCGKVERFQQTLKKWLRAQPTQPTTIAELQAHINAFVDEYNHHRPHRSLPHRATPAALYNAMPKAVPTGTRGPDTHDRVRHDIVNDNGSVTLRVAGKLRHIGIGRTHARTHIILLITDLDVRIINAITGELLRELTIDPAKDYQPQKPKDPDPLRGSGSC
jgi:transposase InsO family protein